LDIDKKHWAYAHRLFQYLVVAVRLLHVEELVEFLAFEFKDGESLIFQADCRHEDPREAVLSTCSSLISVIDTQSAPAIVQFSHFSVKEYLTAARIAEGRVARYYIPLEPAHVLVTRACLSILLQLDDKATNKRTKDFNLVGYAVYYWVKHAKLGNALSQTEDMVKRLFDPRKPHFVAWSSRYDEEPLSRPTPLHYAALFNLCGVAEWLVNARSQNINALGSELGTPLHAASARGSLEVMQFLLTRHADDNRVSEDHTAFYLASEEEQVTVPRVFVNQSVIIEDEWETPLTAALNYGPTETVMEATNLLLDHGANPGSTEQGESPIYVAVSNSHYEVVHLLQRHGADLKIRDGFGRTILHMALQGAHEGCPKASGAQC